MLSDRSRWSRISWASSFSRLSGWAGNALLSPISLSAVRTHRASLSWVTSSSLVALRTRYSALTRETH